MNSKAKGSRRERQARDLLYSWGAIRVVRSGASLGEFDLLGICPGELLLVQVKSNRWPSKAEMARLRAFPRLTYLKKLVFRYNDRQKHPEIRTISEEEYGTPSLD